MKNKWLGQILYIILILLIPACIQRKSLQYKKLYLPKYKQPKINDTVTSRTIINGYPPVTLWVHGSRLFPRSWFTSFFHSEPGIKTAREVNKKYHLRIIAETLIESNPELFVPETFYLFGWAGKLSFTEREQAASDLYLGLKQIIAHYKKQYNKDPFIRIITHSHGGNVVLNLAKIKKDIPITIDQLILLACPVQERTKHYIKDPMFKKAYVLYSPLDMLQVIDPQGLHKQGVKTSFFSRRRFPEHEKLDQVKIKMNGRAISHIEFLLPKFVYHVPTLIKQIDQWEGLKNQNIPRKKIDRLLCINTKKKHSQSSNSC